MDSLCPLAPHSASFLLAIGARMAATPYPRWGQREYTVRFVAGLLDHVGNCGRHCYCARDVYFACLLRGPGLME